MATGKTIALTRWTFVGKVMSLLFNMLTRLVIAFLPRRKHLLISWLLSPSAVILEPPKIKSLTVSIVSPSICHEVKGLDAMILVFECWIQNSTLNLNLSFECWVLSQLFHSPLSLSSRGCLVLELQIYNKDRTESSHMPHTRFPLLTSYITLVTLITVNDIFFPIPLLLTCQCLLYLKWFLVNEKYLAIFNLPWQSSN